MAPRTDAERVEFSHRSLHDVQVFFHVGRTLIRWRLGLGKPLAWEVEMALVESFALHTRALSDFFFIPKRSKNWPDNAFAFDFFDHANQWKAPEQGPWLRRIKLSAPAQSDPIDRFGAHLGHLTFKRPEMSDYARGWPVMQVTAEIGVALRAFLEQVPAGRVQTDFQEKAHREIPVNIRLDDELLPMAVWTRPITTRPLAR